MLSIRILIWCLLQWYCKACIVNGKNQCDAVFLNCPLRENCFVSCTQTQSCANKTILCPITGDCSIQCLGSESCKNSVISATLLSGNLNINCKGNASQCSGITIYGNTLPTNDGAFTMSCSGNYASCINSDIHCPINGDCTLSCDGDTACQRSTITSPKNHALTINCNAVKSCIGAIFDGVQASKLNITGCRQHKSCLGLSVYCPPRSDGHKQCYIEGNDNLGKDKGTQSPTSPTLPPTASPTYAPTVKPTHKPSMPPSTDTGQGIKLYAINGWQDIHIKYNGTFGEAHDGIMRCGENYAISCDIAEDAWSCGADTVSNCNSAQMSAAPTKLATLSPTARPTKISTTSTVLISATNNTVNDNTHTGLSDKSFTQRVRADIFILSGVGLVIITCLCVGCAQIRKNIHDLHQVTVPQTQRIPPYDASRSHRSYSRSHRSHSRSHYSHMHKMDPSRSHRSHRGSRNDSVYDHPIQLTPI